MTESVATHTLRFAKQASNFRLSHRSSFSSFTFASTRPSVPSLDLPIPFSGWRRYLGGGENIVTPCFRGCTPQTQLKLIIFSSLIIFDSERERKKPVQLHVVSSKSGTRHYHIRQNNVLDPPSNRHFYVQFP